MKEADVGIVLKTSQITIEANSCILHEEDKLYPPKRGFFFKREKVYLDSIQSICDVIQAKVNNMFKGHISLYIKTIDEINKTKQSELESINLCITREKVKIENYKSEIAEYKNKIESLNQEKAEILHIKKQDEETRAMYLKYANKAYSEQRKEMKVSLTP